MEEKLKLVLEFLKENRDYNKNLQIKFALGSVGHHKNTFDKLMALLYDTANTQSQPKMDLLATFFKNIYENKGDCNSFYDFINYLNKNVVDEKMPFRSLYEGLKSQKGWGEKTSSLFVKNIYNYHHNFQLDELKIWSDVPYLGEKDKLYLPADSVIKFIFNKLSPETNRNGKPKDWTFDKINDYFSLNEKYKKDILLLDDLWFWGFITQKVEDKQRKLEWNENKYWMIKESDKNEIEGIKEKAEKFIKIIGESKDGE